MTPLAAYFLASEDGAVTVDWVVLTAAIVGLGIAVLTSVGGGTTVLADKTSTHLASRDVTTSYGMATGGSSSAQPINPDRDDS